MSRSSRPFTDAAGRIGPRSLVVVGATAAAAAVWLLAVPVADVDLAVVMDGQAEAIGLREVVVTALGAGLLGWAALELLERVSGRGVAVWRAIALVVLGLSLVGPLLWGDGAASTIVLVVMHLSVAAVLVPLLPR